MELYYDITVFLVEISRRYLTAPSCRVSLPTAAYRVMATSHWSFVTGATIDVELTTTASPPLQRPSARGTFTVYRMHHQVGSKQFRQKPYCESISTDVNARCIHCRMHRSVAKWLVRLPLKAYINLSVCLAGRVHFLMLGKPKRHRVSTYLVVTVNARARPRLTDSAALKAKHVSLLYT